MIEHSWCEQHETPYLFVRESEHKLVFCCPQCRYGVNWRDKVNHEIKIDSGERIAKELTDPVTE